MTTLDDGIIVDDTDNNAECTDCSSVLVYEDGEIYACSHCDNDFCETCVNYCNSCHQHACDNHYDTDWDMCDSCKEDHSECYMCDDIMHDNYSYTVYYNDGREREVCESCANRRTTWCDNCDQREPEDEACGYQGGRIHDYSYKPLPIFHAVDNDPDVDRFMFMGTELEVEDRECHNGGAQIVEDALGNLVYCKHDGSLNNGFEIVTHPMTLAYVHQLDWSFTEKLIQTGHRSWDTDTCGIHIHVDRRAFTGKKHMYAFSLLLMRNRALSYVIAGRNNNHYAKFDEENRKQIPQTLKRGRTMDRYTAVNCNPYSTIEVRMFRGSLKPERIMCAFEYLHAAIEYTRHVKTGLESSEYLTAPAFIQWVRSFRTYYPNLVNYINTSAEFGISVRNPRIDNQGE